MPRLFIILILLVLPLFSIAQTLEDQQCGHQYLIQQQELKTPGYLEEVQNYIQNILIRILNLVWLFQIHFFLRVCIGKA